MPFLVIVIVWVVMLVVLGVRHVALRRAAATRRRSSRVGLLLQAAGYAGVFGIRAPHPLDGWMLPPSAVGAMAVTITVAGAAVVVWSQHVLGVQWSLTARLIAQHRLVTSGPYAYVRHPIYAAMILMLIGTGMAWTTPVVTGVALASYLAGTLVRVRAEESLMRDAFGSAWDDYARRVRALLPLGRR